MCSFYQQGLCKRAENCSFAHDHNELQAKPDLGCTKLCPALLSEGQCPQMDRCKFAHRTAELRTIDVEGLDMPIAAVSSAACALSGVDQRELVNSGSSNEQGGLETTEVTRQVPQRTSQVESRLKDASISGALALSGMIFHLTRIFLALYEEQPEVADRVGVAADVLARATAEETWADAGLDRSSLLSFKEFASLCALPLELMPRNLPPPVRFATSTSKVSQPHVPTVKSVARADSDAWSQCSTDDSCSDVSLRTPSGWQTPTTCDELEDEWYAPEMQIVNTFIHFSTPSIPTANKRAQSVPSRLYRAA